MINRLRYLEYSLINDKKPEILGIFAEEHIQKSGKLHRNKDLPLDRSLIRL